MSLGCNEGGENHMWCHPDFDEGKNQFRVCIRCKVSQTKVWKNDPDNGEAADDTGMEASS